MILLMIMMSLTVIMIDDMGNKQVLIHALLANYLMPEEI